MHAFPNGDDMYREWTYAAQCKVMHGIRNEKIMTKLALGAHLILFTTAKD